MYKLDKTFSATKTFSEAEESKKFPPETPLAERLRQAWYLTCMSYGIDPQNPVKMDKNYFSMRKHEK